jgi:photosystem II stability/assembly factor-like uncharacterized protein
MIHTARRIVRVRFLWRTGAFLLLLLSPFQSTLAQTSWLPSNDGLYGGTITAFAFPGSNSILAATDHALYRYIPAVGRWSMVKYGLVLHAFGTGLPGTFVGASNSGISRSTDSGSSWSEVFTGERPTAFATTTTGTILAVIAHAENGRDSGAYLRSSDDGVGWMPLRIDTGIIRTTTVVASPSGSIFAVADGRLYRSNDDARNFSPLSAPLLSESASLAVIQNDSSLLAATLSGGIQRSTDDGESWTKIDTLAATTLITTPDASLYAIVCQATPWYIPRNGINRSTDGGASWNRLTPVLPRTLTGAPNGEIWLALANTVLVSDDHGTNWRSAVAGITNTWVPEVIADSRGYIYAKIDGGYFRSNDQGTIWSSLTNNPGVDTLQVAPGGALFGIVVAPGDPPNPNLTYDVLYTSTDHGESWRILARDHHIGKIAANVSGALAFGSSSADEMTPGVGSIHYSFNHGVAWNDTAIGSTTVVAVSPSGGITAATVARKGAMPISGQLRRTLDSGRTWTIIRDSVVTRSLATAPDDVDNDKGMIYAQWRRLERDSSGTLREADPGFYRWSDSVGGWNQLLTDTTVSTIRFDERGTMFAEVILPNGQPDLVRSSDSGGSWGALALDNGRPVMPMIFRPAGVIFGLSEGNIYRSTDYGASWVPDGGMLRTGSIMALARDTAGYLYAGTAGDGLYRSMLPSGRNEPRDTPSSPLSWMEPNPLHERGTLTITLSSPGIGRIDVVNALGELMQTYRTNRLEAGRNRLGFDASAIPSGIYFLQISLPSEKTIIPIVVQ